MHEILVASADEEGRGVKYDDLLLYQKYIKKKNLKIKIVIIVAKEVSFVQLPIKNPIFMDLYIDAFVDDNHFINWPSECQTELKNYLKTKNVTFQHQQIALYDFIEDTDELMTKDLIEKIFKNEKISIGNSASSFDTGGTESFAAPTFLRTIGYNTESFSEMEFVNLKEKVFVIKGPANIGKSNIMMNLLNKIQQKVEHLQWILKINCQNFYSLLQNKNTYNCDESEISFYKSDEDDPDYGKILLRSLLNISEKSPIYPNEKLNFKHKLFQHFFEEGNLCIFVDGFDEITSNFHENLLLLFEKIKNDTENRLFITTRPHLLHVLERRLQVNSFLIGDSTKEDQEQYHITNSVSTALQNLQYGIAIALTGPSLLFPPLIIPTLSLVLNASQFTNVSINSSPTDIHHTKFSYLEIDKIIQETLAAELSSREKIDHHISEYHAVSFWELLWKLKPESFQKLIICQTDQPIDVEDFVFFTTERIKKFTEKIQFTDDVFKIYFVAHILMENIVFSNASKDAIFETLKFLFARNFNIHDCFASDTNEYPKIDILIEMLQKFTIHYDYFIELHYKMLVANNVVMHIDSKLFKIVAQEFHNSFVKIILRLLQFKIKEEESATKNLFLYTDGIIDDTIIKKFFNESKHEIFKELLLFSKKIPISPDELECTPKQIQIFICSVGFQCDPGWTKKVITANVMNNLKYKLFFDYSEILNQPVQDRTLPEAFHKQQITPQYTILDLVNISKYYEDEEKLEIIKMLFNAGCTEATWSFASNDFDNKSSSISCIAQAAIAHDHIETFNYFVSSKSDIDFNLLLLIAAKFSCKQIILRILERIIDKVSDQEILLLVFIHLLSNEEMYRNLYLHFPMSKTCGLETMVRWALDCSFMLTPIKKCLEQNYYSLNINNATKLSKYAFSLHRNDVVYYLRNKFEIFGYYSKELPTLVMAVKSRNVFDVAYVSMLLSSNTININEKDDDGNTALHHAYDNIELVRLLLSHGAIYNPTNKKFEIPSPPAATDAYDLLQEVDKTFCLKIFEYNEDNIVSILNARNYKGQTLMHVVLEKGKNDEIKFIFETYFEKCKEHLSKIINAEDFNNDKPLHIAVKRNNFAVFKILLQHGAFYDEKTKNLLNETKAKRNPDFLKFYNNAKLAFSSLKKFLSLNLRKTVFDINTQDQSGKTALHYATEKRDLNADMIDRLQNLKANINIVDKNGNAPIDVAFMNNHNDIFMLLFNSGAKLHVNIISMLPQTDIAKYHILYKKCYECIINHNFKSIQRLILNNAKFSFLNVIDVEDNTLLHHAVTHNAKEIVFFLLKQGFPFNGKNKYGNYPEDLAADQDVKNMLELIKDLFHAAETKRTTFSRAQASSLLNKVQKVTQIWDLQDIVKNAKKQYCDDNIYKTRTLIDVASMHEKMDFICWLNRFFVNEDYSIQDNFQIPLRHDFYDSNINAIGIDLGTTECCAAVIRKHGPELVVLDIVRNSRTMPSYIAYDEKNPKFGQIVVDRMRNKAEYSVYDTKRILGKEIGKITVDPSWPFKIISASPENTVQIEVETFNGKESKTCEEITADLLTHIKTTLEIYQAEKLTEAVITIPSGFSNNQKAATLEAAEMAGFQKIHFLPEPIAAAFAFFTEMKIPEKSKILICDCGGGIVDICIAENYNQMVVILNYDGVFELRGRDFDTILFDYFNGILKHKFGIDVMKTNKKFVLMQKCQNIKHTLSVQNEYWLDVSDFVIDSDEIIKISREEFEEISANLLLKIKNAICRAVSNSNLNRSQIDYVFQVGGGCRIPMIKEMLKQIFPGSKHQYHLYPDCVVAHGAALFDYFLKSKQKSGIFEPEEEEIIPFTPIKIPEMTEIKKVEKLTAIKSDLNCNIMSPNIKFVPNYPIKLVETKQSMKALSKKFKDKCCVV